MSLTLIKSELIRIVLSGVLFTLFSYRPSTGMMNTMKKVMRAYFGHPAIIFYFLIAFALLVGAYLLNPALFVRSLWIIVIPIVLAPFFEWWAHKYILHKIIDPARKPGAYNYQLALHYKHHWNPNELTTVFAPVSAALILFLAFVPVGYLVFGNLTQGLLLVGSIVLYFLYYEWIHLAHHVPGYKPLTAFGKHMRNAHTWHHFKNENFWWGVTNPLGDYALGTFKDPKEVEFSPGAKSLGDLQNHKSS